ncbi:hypothetical protein Tco_1377725 [Tanacetum coccineum]
MRLKDDSEWKTQRTSHQRQGWLYTGSTSIHTDRTGCLMRKTRKARTLLLNGCSKRSSTEFSGMDDAKRAGQLSMTGLDGNANSKENAKSVLKTTVEAFTISSKESLEKGYDRFQKLLSQLDALGASVSDEDANHKFLRSLPPAWDSLAMTMRTKKNIDTLSIDDLYNNLSVFEQDIQKCIILFLNLTMWLFLSQLKPHQASISHITLWKL